jgi:GDP-L-fucose synthase
VADACLHLLEHYDGLDQVNVGTGTDVTIQEIAETVASVVGYTCRTECDTSKPDGTPQKLLDAEAGRRRLDGEDRAGKGLRSTVEQYRASRRAPRVGRSQAVA